MVSEQVYTESELDSVAASVLSQAGTTRLFLLRGEPGSGKTSLVGALCKRLGVKAEVTSPTFSLVNEYALADGSVLYHLDLYRIKSAEELFESGIAEHLDGLSYCFVEWPELIGQFPHAEALQIELHYRGLNRSLKISRLQQN